MDSSLKKTIVIILFLILLIGSSVVGVILWDPVIVIDTRRELKMFSSDGRDRDWDDLQKVIHGKEQDWCDDSVTVLLKQSLLTGKVWEEYVDTVNIRGWRMVRM